MKKNECILGLDISTACSGFSILDGEGNLVKIGYVELNRVVKKKKMNIYEKGDKIKELLEELNEEFNIKYVFIEEPIAAMGRRSSSHTITLLQGFNAVISQDCYRVFGFEPEHINVRSARKTAGIPQKKGDKDIKLKVLKELTIGLGYEVPIEVKRTGKIRDQTLDSSDALLMAHIGYLRLK